MWTMRSFSVLYLASLSLLPHSHVLASEQQPFEFGEMSPRQYSLPKLPFGYDVSVSL